MSNVFNNNHPELKKGEIFLLNIGWNEFNEIKWKTKRQGKHAYTNHGRPVKRLVPVFVQHSELEAAGYNSDDI